MKAKAWEATIDLWVRRGNIWFWELIVHSQMSIIVQCDDDYRTESAARRAARRAMKRLGLVEREEK